MHGAILTILLAGATLFTGPPSGVLENDAVAPDEREPRTVVVRMVEKSVTEFVFEPENITVFPGDLVQFVHAGGIQPHNVEFRNEPAGASLDGVRMGPFIFREGEVYSIRIDERFTEGTYPYVCTPHELMGMVGTITVAPAPEGAVR